MTDYGQFTVTQGDGWDGDADRFFAGQVNGWVAAAVPGVVHVVMARRSGGSGVRVELWDRKPAPSDWDEVVEVSAAFREGDAVRWDAWFGGGVVALPAGSYRVRVSAQGRDAGDTSYADAGLWSVDWQCAPGKLADIVALVQATLAEVAEHGITAAELARAQGQMRGQTVLSYESPSSRMSRLGGNAVLGDDRTLTEVLDRFDAVDAAQVQAAAAALFSAAPVLGLVGPRVPARVLRDWGP